MMKPISPWLTVCVVFGLGSAALPAWAGSSLEPPTAMSMVDALQVEPRSASHLNDLASLIQARIDAAYSSGPAGTLDSRQVPVIGGLIDEEGNLNLPLGLVLYNTMGDISIGFGSKF